MEEIMKSKGVKYNFGLNEDKIHIDNLSKEECVRFGEALEEFKNCIMTPALKDALEANKMIGIRDDF